MQWLANLVAHLGTSGACANAARSLTEEREVTAQVERFLVRFSHPAGQARVPVEPPAGACTRVA